MKMLQKMISWEGLENSLENLCQSLFSQICKPIVCGIQVYYKPEYLLEYVPRTNCLKKCFKEVCDVPAL